MCRTHFCTRCQTIKQNQFEILFHICFLPYQNLKSCENFYDNAVRLSAGFISKLLHSIVVFYCMKFICFQNFGNNRETKSQKQSFPQTYTSSSPHPLLCLHPYESCHHYHFKCNTDCSQSHFRSLMIGDTYSCHNISQVSATLGPQALSALILKLECRSSNLKLYFSTPKNKKKEIVIL